MEEHREDQEMDGGSTGKIKKDGGDTGTWGAPRRGIAGAQGGPGRRMERVWGHREDQERDGGAQGRYGEGWRSTDRIRRRREGAQGGSGLASHNPSESFQPSPGVGLCDRDSRDGVQVPHVQRGHGVAAGGRVHLPPPALSTAADHGVLHSGFQVKLLININLGGTLKLLIKA